MEDQMRNKEFPLSDIRSTADHKDDLQDDSTNVQDPAPATENNDDGHTSSAREMFQASGLYDLPVSASEEKETPFVEPPLAFDPLAQVPTLQENDGNKKGKGYDDAYKKYDKMVPNNLAFDGTVRTTEHTTQRNVMRDLAKEVPWVPCKDEKQTERLHFETQGRKIGVFDPDEIDYHVASQWSEKTQELRKEYKRQGKELQPSQEEMEDQERMAVFKYGRPILADVELELHEKGKIGPDAKKSSYEWREELRPRGATLQEAVGYHLEKFLDKESEEFDKDEILGYRDTRGLPSGGTKVLTAETESSTDEPQPLENPQASPATQITQEVQLGQAQPAALVAPIAGRTKH